MSRDPLAYVVDMLACAKRVVQYAEGRDFQAFAGRGMAYDAILRNLEVLGEAAKGAYPSTGGQVPRGRRRSLTGLRDVLIRRQPVQPGRPGGRPVGLRRQLSRLVQHAVPELAGRDGGGSVGVQKAPGVGSAVLPHYTHLNGAAVASDGRGATPPRGAGGRGATATTRRPVGA